MSGSKKTETTQATRDPWKPAQPLLQDVLEQGRAIGGDVSNFTPTFSANTRAGMEGIAQMGMNPLAQADAFRNLAAGTRAGYDTGQGTLMSTASGGMLGGNPYLDEVLRVARENAATGVNAQFSGAGRYGSGAHTGALARELGNIETTARMNNFNTERANQMNAAGILHNAGLQSGQFAAGIDQAELQRLGFLSQAGGMQDQMDAAVRQAPINAVNFQAGLGIPIAGLGGTTNTNTTSSTPANTMGMIAGAGMMGLGALTGNMNMVAGGLGSIGSSAGGGGMMSGGGGNGGGGGGGGSVFAPSPVYSAPGTAMNGGWSTTATPAPWWQRAFGG